MSERSLFTTTSLSQQLVFRRIKDGIKKPSERNFHFGVVTRIQVILPFVRPIFRRQTIQKGLRLPGKDRRFFGDQIRLDLCSQARRKSSLAMKLAAISWLR